MSELIFVGNVHGDCIDSFIESSPWGGLIIGEPVASTPEALDHLRKHNVKAIYRPSNIISVNFKGE